MVEIIRLRKENVEVPELRRKFAEVETENEKLRQGMKEYESRFTKLAKLDNDIKGIRQDQNVTNSQEAKFQISDSSSACLELKATPFIGNLFLQK